MATFAGNPRLQQGDFVALKAAIMPYVSGKGLEIGPFDRPFLTKEETDVQYLD